MPPSHGRSLSPPHPRPPGATSLPLHCHRPGRQHVVLRTIIHFSNCTEVIGTDSVRLSSCIVPRRMARPCWAGNTRGITRWWSLETPPHYGSIPQLNRKEPPRSLMSLFVSDSRPAAELACRAVEMYHISSDSCQCNSTQKNISFCFHRSMYQYSVYPVNCHSSQAHLLQEHLVLAALLAKVRLKASPSMP